MMPKMSFSEAQKVVDDWIKQFEEGYWPPLSMLASLVEEIGELARELNAVEKYKRKKETEGKADLELEVGDTLFSLICIANHFNIDLERALKKAMEKYTERDMERWTLKNK